MAKEWEAASSTADLKNGELEPFGFQSATTLRNLSVPLLVKAPVGCVVLFHSPDGGQFDNGLALFKTTTNAAGLASANWISLGDSVEMAKVDYRSPSASKESDGFRIRPVRLTLKPLSAFNLPEMPATPKILEVPHTPDAPQFP